MAFGNLPACAACKHQRKKCDDNCELAPYFPASQYQDFQNAQKLFGLSNIQKNLNGVEPHLRDMAAKSIIMEGKIKKDDPVHGCLGIVCNLKSQIEFCEKELEVVNQRLSFCRKTKQLQEQSESSRTKSSLPLLPPSFNKFSHSVPLLSIPPDQQLGAISSPQPSLPSTKQFGTSFLQSQSLPASLSTSFQRQLHDQQILPDLPGEAFFTGDTKNFDHGYIFQTTLEEGADVKPFDIQSFDQIMDSYQHERDFTSLKDAGKSSAESKANGKQHLDYVREEEVKNEAKSPMKGKECMAIKKERN